jgi:hypothetical protein
VLHGNGVQFFHNFYINLKIQIGMKIAHDTFFLKCQKREKIVLSGIVEKLSRVTA